ERGPDPGPLRLGPTADPEGRHARRDAIRLRLWLVRVHAAGLAWPMQELLFAAKLISVGRSYCPEGKPMVKAVLNHGEIRPLEPLPIDWQEGQPLRVEKIDDGDRPVEAIDRDRRSITGTEQAAAVASIFGTGRLTEEQHRGKQDEDLLARRSVRRRNLHHWRPRTTIPDRR